MPRTSTKPATPAPPVGRDTLPTLSQRQLTEAVTAAYARTEVQPLAADWYRYPAETTRPEPPNAFAATPGTPIAACPIGVISLAALGHPGTAMVQSLWEEGFASGWDMAPGPIPRWKQRPTRTGEPEAYRGFLSARALRRHFEAKGIPVVRP